MPSIIPPPPNMYVPFNSYEWADWYQKVRNAINNAQTVQWTTITNTPTTVLGYGITDGVWSNTQIRIQTTIANGAGASVGTLTNAPVAGNPTKWLSVNDNGVTRYIPAW